MKTKQLDLRKIDALVAEKVIGNDIFSIGGDEPSRIQEGREISPGKNETRNLGHYTTNIQDAFTVVEAMRRKNFAFEMEICVDIMTVEFYAEGRNYESINLEDESLALLICQSALKALGISVEDAEESNGK